MLCEAVIHFHRHRVNVAEECCRVLLRFNVHARIPKIRRSSHLRHLAVHDDRGHPVPWLEVQAIAVPVAVWHVPIRSLIVWSTPEVLDGHEVLLANLLNAKRKDVVDIVIYASGQPRYGVPIGLFLPVHLYARLLGLPRIGEVATSAPVCHRRVVKPGPRRLLHRHALLRCQKVFNCVNLRRRPVNHDSHFPSPPPVVFLGLGGVDGRICAGVVFPGVCHLLSYLSLKGDLLVGHLDLLGDALLDACRQFLEDGGGGIRVDAVDLGQLSFGGGFAIVEEFGG
mmetsp:Transcript_13978/g.30351  ORF Transcript_13978/g.30351 Transcript_13978/m.30351 type:complete len:282 (-) Transcript_13978:740-1585(-)